jgi:hypothetical protein
MDKNPELYGVSDQFAGEDTQLMSQVFNSSSGNSKNDFGPRNTMLLGVDA